MNVILKDRVKVTNEEIRENETAFLFLKEKAEMQHNHIHRLGKDLLEKLLIRKN